MNDGRSDGANIKLRSFWIGENIITEYYGQLNLIELFNEYTNK